MSAADATTAGAAASASTSASTSATTASDPWDAAATGWNHNAALIRRWLASPTEAMLDAAGIAAGQRVLDLAAGAGDQTLDLARRVGPAGHVLATDRSAVILELAAANLRAAGLTQVETRRADMQALDIAGAGFDAAVSRLGLMFCAAPLLALQQVHRALAPGGRFAALVFGAADRNPCIAIMMRTALAHAGLEAGAPPPGSLLSLGGEGRLAQLFGEAGYVDVRVQALDVPMRLPCCADYVAFVRESGSPVMEILRPLPEAARDAAWADITAQLDRFSTPEGWVGPNQLLLCCGARPAR